jgi:hypothetical protein
MTPKEFLESLLRNYGKRHATPEDEIAWHRDMRAVIGNPSPDVLFRAYEIIRDTHEERAFPLPSTIRKALDQAAGAGTGGSNDISPELQARFDAIRASRRRKPTAEEIAEDERIQAWQAEQIAKYGSWEGYHRAVHGGGTAAHRGKPSVGKAAFEAMQDASPNAGLHMTRHGLSQRSKAMSGDREDAA